MRYSTTIRTALSHDDVISSDLDMSIINQQLSDLDRLDKLSDNFSNPDNQKAFTFISLRPVSFEKQKLFGSHVPAEQAQEIRVIGAKQDSKGDWVPDESNTYFKALITQRCISDALFNSSRGNGEAITLTELNGVKADGYEPFYSAEDQYGKGINKASNTVFEALSGAIEEVKRLQLDDVALSNKEKSTLISHLESILRYSQRGYKYDLKSTRELLEKDFQHIKAEVISSITNKVLNVSKQLLLESNVSNNTDSDIIHHYKTHNEVEGKEDIATLLERYADTMTGHAEKDEARSVRYCANNISNTHVKEVLKTGSTAKGWLDIGTPSGGAPFFFGDASGFNHNWFELRFNFVGERMDRNGEITLSDSSGILTLGMTRYQIMDLLQSALTGDWVKSTMSNYLGTILPLPEASDQHDEYTVDIPEDTVETKELTTLVEEALVLANSSSKAAKTKIKLLEITQQLTKALEEENISRKTTLQESQAELADKFFDKSQAQIENLLETVGESHPEIKKMIPKLLHK